MTTSKIKNIHEVKEFTNDFGTTFYHNLEMENGDKINIGKKKKQLISWELTYEIIGDKKEDGSYQQEFPKAKAVKPEGNFSPKKNDDYIKGIEVGHAVNNAVNLMAAGVELDCEWKSNEEKIYKYAKVIMAISNRLKKE